MKPCALQQNVRTYAYNLIYGVRWQLNIGIDWLKKISTLFLFGFLFRFFSIRIFFHGHRRLTRQQGKRGDHLLFHSTTSTRSRTFRHLFATFHVRWLSHIFNRTTCIYQTASRWDLPNRMTIWLIDNVVCLFTCQFDSRFLLQQFDTGNR